MIPLKDTVPARNQPWVTYAIILANLLVFLLELSISTDDIQVFFYRFGMVPTQMDLNDPGKWGLFLSSMLLHGGIAHFIGNMWTLWIFGDNVEDKMGHGRYIIFYLLCGVIAGLTHYALNIQSTVPAIGASGAISGVMAAYMILFPKSRIIFLIPIFIFPLLFEISAVVYILIWFIAQLFSGTAFLIASPAAATIAFWAHIGGFLGGLILHQFFLKPKKKRPPTRYDAEFPLESGGKW